MAPVLVGAEMTPVLGGALMAPVLGGAVMAPVLGGPVMGTQPSVVVATVTSGAVLAPESSGSAMVPVSSKAVVSCVSATALSTGADGAVADFVGGGEVAHEPSNPNQQGRSSSKGYTCPHCGIQGIVGPSKLQVHIDRMHSALVVCKICNVTFVDKFSFVKHYPSCFFFCPRPNCNFHDKRKQRFVGHMRTHDECL